MRYRVKQHCCIHAGIEYNVGDIMPQLPVDLLNVHLPNLELVDVPEPLVDDSTDPTAVSADQS